MTDKDLDDCIADGGGKPDSAISARRTPKGRLPAPTNAGADRRSPPVTLDDCIADGGGTVAAR